MALSPTQQATLKAAILANTDTIPAGQPWTGAFAGTQVNAVPNTSDGNTAVAGYYNLPASPTWTVWRTLVQIADVGDKLNGTELAGLSSLNHTRLQTVVILSSSGVNPSMADRRQFFDDIFSGAGGNVTRPALLALWKKLASRCQRLANFSSGTGSDLSPATLASNVSQEFLLTAADVETARNLP